MIVYDLACDNAHRFEIWFRSSGDFADQRERGLVSCPECGSQAVAKAPMAPAVPAKSNTLTTAGKTESGGDTGLEGGKLPEKVRAAMAALAKEQRKTIKDSTWVGEDFAALSREMHYGERDEKLIHGRATKEEALDLIEEGIGIAPLLVPVVPPEEAN
ncbi:DUF1178 family protein [Erythrobacteraceae bacterium WH01K]|nr:DUF1178 family protein [Erythrobacteraceae bacterium WH01K]